SSYIVNVALASMPPDATTVTYALSAAEQIVIDARIAASFQPVASYTYNSDGTVNTATEGGVTTTFTYNSDGTVHTMTRNSVTRTLAYNADGTVSGVS